MRQTSLVAFCMAIFAALALLSCGSAPFAPAVHTLNATGVAMKQSRAALLEQYEREQFAAIDAAETRDEARAELAHIRTKYKPIFEKYNAARDLWHAAEKLVRGAIKDHEAGKPADHARTLRAVMDAAEAVKALTQPIKERDP